MELTPRLDDWQRQRPELGYRLPPRPVDAARPSRGGLGWTLGLTNRLPQPDFGAAAGEYAPPQVATAGLVPLREAFGPQAVVEFDARTKRATVRSGGSTIEVTAGSAMFTVNGGLRLLDTPAILKDGKMLVPRALPRLARQAVEDPTSLLALTRRRLADRPSSLASGTGSLADRLAGLDDRPRFQYDADVFRSWPRESLRFGMGEARAAVGLINPVDWWKGGEAIGATHATYGSIEGTARLASGFVDSLWPFNETDTYQAGQEFMDLTLTTAPALAVVPSTELPVVGARLRAAMSQIPYTVGKLLPVQQGVTDSMTGAIAISRDLVRQAARDPLAAQTLSETIAHERFHAVHTLRLPTPLRSLDGWAYGSSATYLYLDEAAAEMAATGFKTGFRHPLVGGYDVWPRMAWEGMALAGSMGLSILGRRDWEVGDPRNGGPQPAGSDGRSDPVLWPPHQF